jgi:hypothetical protein
MSENEELGPDAPYTITLKGGAGFEAPWLVVRATSADDATALLAEAVLAELPEKIAEFAGDFRAKVSGGKENAGAKSDTRSSGGSARGGARRGSGSRGGQSSKPEPKSDDVEYHPDGDVCKECDEPVVYKEINSRGKKYELWVCPNQRQKNDGHYSAFIN